jgi:glucose-1-phosphate cytidylyltransferase
MKAIILAGGFGSRLSEETILKPKPLIELGDKPIIWHIMKIYSYHGINEFIICCGYKGYQIKEYFANYFLHMSDITFDMKNNTTEVHQRNAEPWKVTLVDTGLETMTGGRLKHVRKFVEDDECFCMTYGDGVADINIANEIEFHKKNKFKATIAAVSPPGRFGVLNINDNKVTSIAEKPTGDGALINGGFFVLSGDIFNYIDGPNSIWEREPLENLAAVGCLGAYNHNGFWHPMDTLRDKIYLDDLWNSGNAPWKTW